MQALNRLVRDVLVVAAVGATASVQADSLLDVVSFEDIAGATLDEFMPWGSLVGEAIAELDGTPVMDPLDPQPTADGESGGEWLSGLGLPDPDSCVLLLGALASGALWRRRVRRRHHAGAIGAYLV